MAAAAVDQAVAYGMTARAGDDGGLYSGGTGPDQLIGGAGSGHWQRGKVERAGPAAATTSCPAARRRPDEDDFGDDVLDGGPGWDTVWVDALYSGAGAPATGPRLDLSNLAQGQETARKPALIAGIEALTGSPLGDTLIGNDGTNHLSGGAGGDVLSGGGGDDALSGGPGDDTLAGDSGNDTLTGDEGSDIASYASSSAGVGARLGAPGSSSNGASAPTC